jgi:hypothetical protein
MDQLITEFHQRDYTLIEMLAVLVLKCKVNVISKEISFIIQWIVFSVFLGNEGNRI